MIRPIRNQLLIQLLPRVTKSDGGIHLVDRYVPDQLLARVLAAGPGRYRKGILVPPEVSPGDYVMLDQYTINSKSDVGNDQWLIDADHVSLCVNSVEASPEPVTLAS